MRRLWFGLGLLLALLTVGVGISARLSAYLDPLTEQVAQAADAARTDAVFASGLLEASRQTWKKCRDFTAAVLDHSPMEQIDGLFATAQSYGKSGIWEAMAAECGRLTEWIQAMAESQRLTWRNLL